jgi:hypothetical protein
VIKYIFHFGKYLSINNILMKNFDKKEFSRIYELMSFDRGKTIYEMEQKWNNMLNEATVPQGSYVRKEIEDSAKKENINKTWVEIKQEFGSNGTETDNIKLYNAWVDGKWRPGNAVPEQYQTDTYKSKPSSAAVATSSGNTQNATKDGTDQEIPDYGYSAVALYGYAYYMQFISQQQADTINSQKYGKLVKYFYNLANNKPSKITDFGLDQKTITDFVADFAKQIKSNSNFLNVAEASGQMLIDYGKGGVTKAVEMLKNPSEADINDGNENTNANPPSNKVVAGKDIKDKDVTRDFSLNLSDPSKINADTLYNTFFGF